MRTHDDGTGLLLIDASVQGHPCALSQISLARLENGALKDVASVSGTARTFGIVSPPPIQRLKAGEYTVTRISCKAGNQTSNFRGPYARFALNSGEAVNVGRLNLEPKSDGFFSGSGTLRKSVQPIADDVLAKETELFPAVMSEMKTRPMVLLGGEESRTVFRPW